MEQVIFNRKVQLTKITVLQYRKYYHIFTKKTFQNMSSRFKNILSDDSLNSLRSCFAWYRSFLILSVEKYFFISKITPHCGLFFYIKF